jgi:hypothetical protein
MCGGKVKLDARQRYPTFSLDPVIYVGFYLAYDTYIFTRL